MNTEQASTDQCVELTVRDELALDRTVLANDRTFLAYMRTALALLAAGMTLITFFGHVAMVVLGWLMLPVAAFTFTVGLRKYRAMQKVLQLTREGRPPYSDMYPTYSKRSAQRN